MAIADTKSVASPSRAAGGPQRGGQARQGARARTAPRRFWADRLARWFVTAGGLGIIASILGILVFILIEVWPLTRAARVGPGPSLAVPALETEGSDLATVATDEHKTLLAGLTLDGELKVLRATDGSFVASHRLLPAAPAASSGEISAPAGDTVAAGTPAVRFTAVAQSGDGSWLGGATSDGRVVIAPFSWTQSYDGDQRRMEASVGKPVTFVLDASEAAGGGGRAAEPFTFAVSVDGSEAAAAGVLADGSLTLVRRTARENLLTGEVSESFEPTTLALPSRPRVLLLDRALRSLYAGTETGALLWWNLAAEPGPPQVVSAGGAGITALALLIGEQSLVVGQEDGGLSVWFPVEQANGSRALTLVRSFPPLSGSVTALSPSMRNKGFLAAGAGGVGLYHSTASRVLWTGPSPLPEARAASLAPRADGAFLAAPGRLASLAIDNPHPEVTWKSLFGKAWYEGYTKPEYVWQSTGGTDDFEPKLSLTPLLIGTLKGTLYSLLLAIPLGVFGAMYTSQFLHPTYQRFVKPTVEIMAALPTVVLGFLAGLWLAPRLEKVFPSLLVMALLLPLLILGAGALWHRLPRAFRGRFPHGIEALIFIVVIAFGMWLSVELSVPVELALFGGNFPRWLLEATGMAYDQRNAVVVGLAMGFAVIPIIFAISEDAFSNVPKNLVSGALALGANRWQTVTRVVLPTASPGIFSAVMVGFGRAVGETMIVLMATGNTPIMDWSPFNGFRTLSANIAVEIPEAPMGGTLYRTLFLAALLLFALTFTVNTAAELVRQRLRRRYSQL